MAYSHAVATPEPSTARDARQPSHERETSPTPHRRHGQEHELDRFAARAVSGPGRPVDPTARARVERATGADLSAVRLHTGPLVRVAARAAGASAFTLGDDVAVAVGPGQEVPQRLLTHELVHAAQQARPGAATPTQAEHQARGFDAGTAAPGALLGTGAAYVAHAATDWLQSTPDVRAYGYSELLDELNAVDEWLGRQVESSPEDDRMREAKEAITAELRRRQGAMQAPDRPRPRGRRGRGRAGAAPDQLPAQTEMPRVLREQTSTQLTDPAEIRAEVDRISSWLQRPDLTRADRSILRQELATLAPGLAADLAGASAERRQARLTQALSPSSAGGRTGLLTNLAMIDSIRPYQEQPGMAYVMQGGELIVFPQETADRVRAQALAALTEAARQARQLNESSQFRMGEHMRLNYEDQPYVGFVVSLVSGEDPVDVQSRMLDPLSDSNIALSRMRSAQERGSLEAMGDAVLTAVEKADEAQRIVLAGIDRAVAAAGTVVQGLTITRNLSAAIALSILAIVAAPVVAAGVAGTGATGLLATGLTAVGTSGVVGAGGFGMGFVGGAGGELAAGRSVEQSLGTGLDEGIRVGKQGAAIGLGGGASFGLARNLGLGAEGLSVGQNLWRGAVSQGVGGGLGGTASGLLQEPPEGRTRSEMALQGGLTGLGLGAFGGGTGAVARTLGSPAAQYALGVGAPTLAAGGVRYLETGDWSQAAQSSAVALAVGSAGRLQASERAAAPRDARGYTPGEARAFEFGRSAMQTGRAYAMAGAMGLANASPAFRMAETGGSYSLSDPRTGAGSVSSSTVQPPVQQAPVPAATTTAPTTTAPTTTAATTAPTTTAPTTTAPTTTPPVATPVATTAQTPVAPVAVSQAASAVASQQVGTTAQSETSFAGVNQATAPSTPLRSAPVAALEASQIPGVRTMAGTHSSSPRVRAAAGVTGADFESAHVLAQTIGAAINAVRPGAYSPGRALAILLRPPVHSAYDQGWIPQWNQRVATGQRTTLGDARDLLRNAINGIPNNVMTPQERGDLWFALDTEINALGLPLNLVLFGGP